ncbi:MAG: MOSC domain-containing protein [Rhizobiaceae bacterium]
MQIKLLSVNTAKPEPINTRRGTSGIFKRPQSGPVAVTLTGLAEDAIIDKANHGGVDQAVYIYTQPDYDWWSAELGRHCEPGLFGENLTVSGLESASVCIGDRYRIGDVLLEVTSPRIPCNTFARRMKDGKWVKRYYAAGRPGIYCRVLQAGSASAGQVVTVEPYAGERVTLGELFSAYPYADISAETRTRYLSAPLHHKLFTHLSDAIEAWPRL